MTLDLKMKIIAKYNLRSGHLNVPIYHVYYRKIYDVEKWIVHIA